MPKSVSIGRPMEEGLLDEIDVQFLILITRGYSNSYAIHRQLKIEAENRGTRTMLYKNANRRILLLVKAGVIEEIKYTERTPHGRIDYRLTMKGLKHLLPYVWTNSEEMQNIGQYMDKFGLDKKGLTEWMLDRVNSILDSVNKYLRFSETETISSKVALAYLELAEEQHRELQANVLKLHGVHFRNKPDSSEMKKKSRKV